MKSGEVAASQRRECRLATADSDRRDWARSHTQAFVPTWGNTLIDAGAKSTDKIRKIDTIVTTYRSRARLGREKCSTTELIALSAATITSKELNTLKERSRDGGPSRLRR